MNLDPAADMPRPSTFLLTDHDGLSPWERASELAGLRWDQIDLKAAAFHVARRKNGSPSTHPLRGLELRALRSWKRQQDQMAPYVFTSLRGGLLTIRTIHFVVAAAGKAAGIKFPVHPHMLRHATGFYLANAGQDTRAIQLYLGHKNIQHTVRYTELSPQRFKDFWKDLISGRLHFDSSPDYLIHPNGPRVKQHFSRVAHTISVRLASAWSYVAGIVLVLAWIVSGPYFNFSQQWQFAMTAGTSIATFLLVLILQHTDYRQIKAMQLKLDELLRAMERARNDLVHLETKPEEQINSLDEEFEQMQARNRPGAPDATSVAAEGQKRDTYSKVNAGR